MKLPDARDGWVVTTTDGGRLLWARVEGYWHVVTAQPHLIDAALRLMAR